MSEDEQFWEEEGWGEDEDGIPQDSTGFIDDDDGDLEVEMVSSDNIATDRLSAIVNTYNAFIFDAPAILVNRTRIKLSLPRSIIPLSFQAVYGFLCDDSLLDIMIEISDADFTKNPDMIEIEHPIMKYNYVGRPLVTAAVEKFFSSSYKPRSEYKSVLYLLTPPGRADDSLTSALMAEQFPENRAIAALILANNDIDVARDFLSTGQLPPNSMKQIELIRYESCPLLYLALEIAEAMLDVQTCCCICRKKLPFPGVRPSICSDKFCSFRLSEIGIGNSVLQEIKRDPQSCDLILSIFSASHGTDFMNPAPPFQCDIPGILTQLPSMQELATCRSEAELGQKIGSDAYTLIRWVILSNLAFIMSLPSGMKVPQFGSSKQFLTLIANAENERKFQELKAKHGSVFLWHGSHGDRWHSIVRNGLKNATGTKLEINGHAHGAGIYFAPESSTSWGYSQERPNKYKGSAFGNRLHIIALCEVAKVSQLKDAGWARTLTLEEACIVRFLMVGGNFQVNAVNNPPKIPSLKEVLEYHATADTQ